MDVDTALVCRKCTKVKELDGIPSPVAWSLPPYPRLQSHLVKALKKYRILDAVCAIVVADREVCELMRIRFLGNVI